MTWSPRPESTGTTCSRSPSSATRSCITWCSASTHASWGWRRSPWSPDRPSTHRRPGIGLDVHPGAMVYTLPLIAGHVGADATGAILSEGPHRREPVQLLVDVGTNAEIVLGNKDRLLAASSPDRSGLRGGPDLLGADGLLPVRSNGSASIGTTFEPRIRVIGQEMWSDEEGFDGSNVTGICGSGIIEVIAELFLAGVIDSDGVMRPQSPEVHAGSDLTGRTYSYLLVGGPPDRDHPERCPRDPTGEGGVVCRGPSADGLLRRRQGRPDPAGGSLREPYRSALRDDPRHDPRLSARPGFLGRQCRRGGGDDGSAVRGRQDRDRGGGSKGGKGGDGGGAAVPGAFRVGDGDTAQDRHVHRTGEGGGRFRPRLLQPSGAGGEGDRNERDDRQVSGAALAAAPS